ncbi:MAG: glycosyltransferase family 39 protein [Candidatus Micrarchaeota archaeon]
MRWWVWLDENTKKLVDAAALAVVLLSFVFTAGQFFAKNTLWLDEATDATIGGRLFSEGVFRNDDGSFVSRAPFSPFSLATFYVLFGKSEFVLYALPFLLALASLSLVFIFVRKLYGTLAGAVASFSMALSALFVFYSLRFLTEMPQILAVSLSLYFFFAVFKDKRFDLAPFLVLGAAMAFLSKPTMVSFFIPLALAVFLFYRKELLEFFSDLRSLGAAALVFIVVMLAVFSYNMAGTGSPIGLLTGYWEAVHVGQDVFPIEWYFTNLGSLFAGVFMLGLIVLGIAYAFWNWDKPAIALFLAFFLSLVIMSFATIFKDHRYVMFVFPAAYGLVGFAAATCLKSVSLSIPKNEEDAIKGVLAVFVLVALAAATVFNYSYVTQFTESRVSSYSEFKTAGAFVESITSPNETVFATGGPELGYYANRKALMFDYLNISNFMRQLEENNARIIVVGIHEHGAEVVAASQKLQANQTQNPQNSFEYLFFNPQVFKPLQGFSSGQNTVMIVFERV